MAPTQKWDTLFVSLIQNNIVPEVINRALLWGPPRTGKTSLACAAFQRKVEHVTLHRQMPIDDLLGGYALIDGTTKWQDGPAIRAMRNGSPLVIDEIDQFSGEIRSLLHALLDDPAGVTLASGERVAAKKGYAVIATTNALPSSLPPPIYDRFDLVLKADTLSEGIVKTLGPLATPAARVVNATDHWTRPASVNLYIAAAKLRRHGLADEKIAKALGLDGATATDFLLSLTTPT